MRQLSSWIPARETAAGWLILAMVVLSLVRSALASAAFDPWWRWVIGLSAAGAALLLFSKLRLDQKIQITLFLLLGVSLLVFGIAYHTTPPPEQWLTRNTDLLTMITAVGFLRLVVRPGTTLEDGLPTGPRAYLKTLLSLAAFGSVINISAPIVIGDRLSEHREMDLFTATSMIRIFCLCAGWSPFFAGTALVLLYVPDARLITLMSAGLPLLLLGIAVQYVNARMNHAERLARFSGYPTDFRSLMIPLLLMLSVLTAVRLLPSVSILIIIAMAALLLTVLLLLFRLGWSGAGRRLEQHILLGLPATANELLLFLAAGVLAAGLTALVDANVLGTPFTHFDALTAITLLGSMIIIAAAGIHPVIQISAITPLLLPLTPSPNLLALTYMFAWALGTSASPLSGTTLIFQGRYGLSAWHTARANWAFAAMMFPLAALILHRMAQ